MANSAILLPVSYFYPVTTNQAMIAGVFYGANSGSQLTFTLPTTANIGDTFSVCSQDNGGYIIAQPASVTIIVGTLNTTGGVDGSIQCAIEGNTLIMQCCVTNYPSAGYELIVTTERGSHLVT